MAKPASRKGSAVKGTRHTEFTRRLHRAIRETSAQATLLSNAIAQRVGITINDIECLDIINLNGPMTAGKIAKTTGLTTGAITGIVDRLCSAGLAVREPDPTDRRRVIVRVSDEPNNRVSPYYRSTKRRLEQICKSYSESELLLLLQFYESSLDALREETAALRNKIEPAS
jgi:DNA-binding MarR family transcriptional regulator